MFREVRRVLADDGTLWLNLGDCYATGAGKVGECPGGGEQGARWRGEVTRHRDEKRRDHGRPALNGRGEPQVNAHGGHRGSRGGSAKQPHTGAAVGPATQPNGLPIAGLKPKDMVGIPWRVAFALQADGWWLRSDIIWHKPNPMPSSVTDRPTGAHEYLFLLAKSERYYYDAEAIAEPAVSAPKKATDMRRGTSAMRGQDAMRPRGKNEEQPDRRRAGFNERWDEAEEAGEVAPTRNARSVWTIASRPFAEAHFATFPPALVEPCIKAGTSERGGCSVCGAPWTRIVERKPFTDRPNARPLGSRGNQPSLRASLGQPQQGGRHVDTRTIGWRPTCDCNAGDPVPDLVLDPFNGAGTTGLVATRLGRRYLGIELNPEYVEMSKRRIVADAPLFNAGGMR